MKQKNLLTSFIRPKLTILEIVFFFILLGILSYGLDSFFCLIYPKFNFDSQIPMTVNFVSSNTFLPYRDIYFPYGILFYLRQHNILFSTMFVFLPPLLFVSFLLYFKKLWNKNIYAYISFFFLFYFVAAFPGIETFRRYGVIAVLGLFFSYIFYKNVFVKSFTSLLIGILIGIVFSLINDQGIYAFLLYSLLLFVNPLIRNGISQLKIRKYYTYLFFGVTSFITGVFFGFLPFLIYLAYNKIFTSFLQYLMHLRDFPLYANTPFIPFSATSDNLFTFSILFLSIFFVFYNLVHRKKYSLSFYVLFSYISILILLEQKSLIRSLDNVITFFTVVMLITLAYELVLYFKYHKIAEIKLLFCYLLLIVIVLFKLNLHPFAFSTYTLKYTTSVSSAFLQKNDNQGICMSLNLNKFLNQEKTYIQVERRIKEDPQFSGKIFNYLSDPIFYVLFNQKPPYYFTIFEATPLYAQKSNIEYIKTNNASHIIYNSNVVALQDGVPDYARQKLLLRYIINNFIINEEIGDFFILKKKTNQEDFFKNISSKKSYFNNYLLNINLGAIPKSEGIYKKKYLFGNKGTKILFSGSSLSIKEFLKQRNVDTSNKVLVLTVESYKRDGKEIFVTLKTKDGKTTSVTFSRCNVGNSCIINLVSIPLFYKERIIKEILVDDNFRGKIELVDTITENSNLW